MKNSVILWQKFEKSGSIADYLAYSRARAEDMIALPAELACNTDAVSIEGIPKLH